LVIANLYVPEPTRKIVAPLVKLRRLKIAWRMGADEVKRVRSEEGLIGSGVYWVKPWSCFDQKIRGGARSDWGDGRNT
jgi:hypothetical protein